MNALVDTVLHAPPALLYTIVTALVFAEDAVFVGFIIPGETAAILGGLMAATGHARLWVMIPAVAAAAIAGDTAGYEIGKRFGPRLLRTRLLRNRQARLETARDLLRRKGGTAVFLGRFTAFFRAVMPALAGTAAMPYRRFFAYNAAGGVVWATGAVLLGYFGGNSYQALASSFGTAGTILAAAVAAVALLTWRLRRRARNHDKNPATAARTPD
ncbi:DedA family protein [Paenarthrobacter sp. DKR-5]|uniref:DedA family protein n=1 Tax=Paenarthrobacter sp. DKR-5 TaxID=2835535 RepID=UPI001BDD5B04|nr:DedA family protein [Paenarthrobacter sp. DKR-5]MBT1004011.1 DedA family protein [Paenarthrobacter sp. DKR-5]